MDERKKREKEDLKWWRLLLIIYQSAYLQFGASHTVQPDSQAAAL
jgi:DNA-binding CsgD family transcriptional regulator